MNMAYAIFGLVSSVSAIACISKGNQEGASLWWDLIGGGLWGAFFTLYILKGE